MLQWVPVFVSTNIYFFSMSDDFWPVFNRTMLESLAGPVAFNWLGMGWAQYQRSKQGTTSFTSSDNMTALGINFAYNMFSIVFTW